MKAFRSGSGTCSDTHPPRIDIIGWRWESTSESSKQLHHSRLSWLTSRTRFRDAGLAAFFFLLSSINRNLSSSWMKFHCRAMWGLYLTISSSWTSRFSDHFHLPADSCLHVVAVMLPAFWYTVWKGVRGIPVFDAVEVVELRYWDSQRKQSHQMPKSTARLMMRGIHLTRSIHSTEPHVTSHEFSCQ